MNETYLRGFKIRIFPNEEQEEHMIKHIHASRFIWNKCKEINDNAYKNNGIHITLFDMINKISGMRDEYPFLKDVSSHALQVVIRDLYYAYDMFFNKKSRYPKFKSKKKCKLAFPLAQDRNTTYFKNDKYVKLPKIGDMMYRFDYRKDYHIISYRFHNPRISYVNNKWILSVALECEKQTQEPTYKRMGIDLGIEYLATVSFGNNHIYEEDHFRNINKDTKMKKLDSKIRHLDRSLARKARANKDFIERFGKDTNNMEKIKRKRQKAYYKMHCIRNNYMHEISCYLVNYKRPLCITMETLKVQNLMKNRRLSKAIQDASFYTFTNMIKYKSDWTTCTGFIQVPINYPSSKRCSQCGSINHKLKLKDRVYICDNCNNKLNRDINAARNLRDYACNKRA